MIPVAFSSKLNCVPERFVVDANAYVAARLDGELVIWPDLCPHMGAQLSGGTIANGEELICPYHSFRFDKHGSVKMPCGTASDNELTNETATLGAIEEHDVLWVRSQGLNHHSNPALPAIAADHIAVHQSMETWRASKLAVLENFIDVAHFATVHTSTFASERGDPEISKLRVDQGAGILTFHVEHYGYDIISKGAKTPKPVKRYLEYKYVHPTSLQILISTNEHFDPNSTNQIVLHITELSENSCKIFKIVRMTKKKAYSMSDIDVANQKETQATVSNEDKSITEETFANRSNKTGYGALHSQFDAPVISIRKMFQKE